MSPRFRSYAENAHWEVGKVLYATVNLPANNNHYLPAAGPQQRIRRPAGGQPLLAEPPVRDRASSDKLEAIVLFSEGDLKPLSEPTGLRALLRARLPDHDGFAEPRRQVLALAQKFEGKVLLVDSARAAEGTKPAIEWKGNRGAPQRGAGACWR